MCKQKKSTRVHILNRSPFTCKLKPARGGCSGLVWDISSCRDPDGAILIPPCGTPDASTETQVEGEGVSLCTSIPWELQDATHWSSSVLRAQWQPQHWMGSWAVKTATSLPLFLGHGDLGEESMGSQRKSNPSGVSGLCWFMSVLQLPITP